MFCWYKGTLELYIILVLTLHANFAFDLVRQKVFVQIFLALSKPESVLRSL